MSAILTDEELALHKQGIEMHKLLVDRLLAELRSDKPLRASLLREVRQFLRDNRINTQTIQEEEQREHWEEEAYRNLPFPVRSPTDGDPF